MSDADAGLDLAGTRGIAGRAVRSALRHVRDFVPSWAVLLGELGVRAAPLIGPVAT